MKAYILFIGLLTLFIGCRNTTQLSLQSPDGSIQLNIEDKTSILSYNITRQGKLIITTSALGLNTDMGEFSALKVIKTTTTEFSEIWEPLFGKDAEIENSYNQISLLAEDSVGKKIHIDFRAFNDGIAFRYIIPQQEKRRQLTVTEDLSEFNFKDNFTAYGSQKNIEAEEFYPKTINTTHFSKLPLLVNTKEAFVAINEAAVNDFSMMYLKANPHKTGMLSDIGISQCTLPLSTPWRVIQMGNQAGDLINSNILVNLNDPCQIEDPSWIKPGKSLWDWRNHGDTIGDFIYGINEESYYRLVDFAAKSNFEYVLFDADWYSEDGPQHPRADLDMAKIINYAKGKNVGILLYLDRRRKGLNNDWQLEEVLKTFSSWGVKGIKYGFLSLEIPNDRKKFVDTTRDIIRLCAQYQMTVNFHDNPVHPGGEERTYPNRMSIEYCHAQQDSRKSFTPYKATSVPYIFGLCGALDMANGYYDLDHLQNRSKVDKNGLNSTVVSETARCLVNYSPLMILPDNGDVYHQKYELFDFIKQMPDTWDESKFIAGEPGQYIIIARRSGTTWFVAGVNNEENKTIILKTDFITKGNYSLTQYLDTEKTHYIHSKDSYKVKKSVIKSGVPIDINMADGGGFALILKKQ